MAEMKYKIGDRVIIEESTVENLCSFKGVEGVIKDILHSESGYDYFVASGLNPFGVWCNVKCLAPEKTDGDKIVITNDGKTTIATLVHADGSKDSATANCSPEDKFDFYTSAKLALDRLAKKDTEIVVEGFRVGDRVNVEGMNGTILCISMGDLFGVQFDDPRFEGHRCLGIKLKAGTPSNKNNCWWVKPRSCNHGEASNEIRDRLRRE